MIFAKRQCEDLEKKGISTEVYLLKTRGLNFKMLRDFFALREQICQKNYDIIHAHYGTFTALFSCLVGYDRKKIITFRGSDLNWDPGVSFLRKIVGLFFSHVSTLFCHKIITVSEKLKNNLKFNKWNAEVILDGVNTKLFYPLDRNDARKKLNLNIGDFIVMFISGSQPVTKGRKFAMSVIAKSKEKIEEFKSIVLETGVSPDEMPFYYQACDVLLFTSLTEGSPLTVKEALACNLSILTVDVGDVAYLIDGVENCFLLPRDESSFVEALVKISINKPRSNGQKFIKKIDQDERNLELIRVYQQVMN
jgi:glycosyltransferase involved in cell wall biosynthesis